MKPFYMLRASILLIGWSLVGYAQMPPAPATAPTVSPAALTNAALQELLHLLPPSEPWEKWLKDTGAQPPDFDLMRGIPTLPDPLRFSDGREVQSLAQWQQRRQELLLQFQFYVLGKVPPPPGNVRAASVKSRVDGRARIQGVTLEFGPEHKAKLNMEVIVPPGPGPFPVFITQDNHRGWALVAVSRGYIGCVYAGADSFDDTAAFPSIWPDYDWTKLTRRAWAASRCLDYLLQLPYVDRSRIALTGHSRNGKQSLIAGALDDRFTAIISSSSGAGGSCTYRLFSETQFGEGIELITRGFPDWLHPRLRFFAGRENKLPIDQHELIACIAPRPCLISTAFNDSVENVWSIEQTYYAAQRVYAFAGAPGALNLRYRAGGHPTKAEDIEAYIDWLDTKFGRRAFAATHAPIMPTYADWLKTSGERVDPLRFPSASIRDLLSTSGGNPIISADQWKTKREDIRQRITWVLGEPPASADNPGGDYGSEPPPTASVLGRSGAAPGVEKRAFNFGNYIAGDLYFPASATNGGPLPAVVWLHPFSVPNGYVAGYRRGEPAHITLARAGFVVLAFDQIGCGARIEEIQRFYQRYPRWSLMGSMVRDTQAAVTVLQKMPQVDRRRIFLLGYATGAMTALHAAALDERIAGVVSVAGFTPMRLDTVDKGAGGIARWSHGLPLLPRLGAFIGHEDHIPYDYHEVLAMIAPRRALAVLPTIDYQASRGDVRDCLSEAHKLYRLLNADENLAYIELPDYNRFSPEMQQEVIKRLRVMANL